MADRGERLQRYRNISAHADYACELRDGQETRLSVQDLTEKVWYGRVLFEDGTPAFLDPSEFTTQVIRVIPVEGGRLSMTIATVDNNGYFAIQLSEGDIEGLKSGATWLTVGVAANGLHAGMEGPMFPAERLALERDKAGVLTIPGPQVYYGRILYENGKPAVPLALPWPGAKVCVVLQTASYDVDKDGYFKACLTDEQFKQLQDGQARLDVRYPFYDRQALPIVGQYPCDLLARERAKVTGYTLRYAEMPSFFGNLRQYVESADHVQGLAAALQRYAGAHNGSYPDSLEQLAAYADDVAWLIGNIEYIRPIAVTTTSESAEVVLAYDKTLLKTAKATHVLFRDGHIEFCQPRRLRTLGISRSDASVSP